jgi:hypothetical protein
LTWFAAPQTMMHNCSSALHRLHWQAWLAARNSRHTAVKTNTTLTFTAATANSSMYHTVIPLPARTYDEEQRWPNLI